MTDAYIKSLFIFPVKSLKGISVNQAVATTSGLEHDRQWAIVNADGQLVTQRKLPQLVCISAEVTRSGLRLRSHDNNTVDVPSPANDSPCIEVKVFQDYCMAQAANKDVNSWLNEALESKEGLRLVKFHKQSERRFAKPERFNIRGQFFSDAAPYLVANQHSLDALNEKLQSQHLTKVDIRHFRPNIIISGPDAFAEHQYTSLNESENQYRLRLVDHCQRCSMITIDPDKGEFLPNATPFKSLSEVNSMPENAKAPAFGVNATLVNPEPVTLNVGQKLVLS